MAYISNADIEERLGAQTYVQLADDDGDAVADVGVVNEARLGAEGEVNSYLARRYRLPIDLAAHPELADLLATITLDLVEFRLHTRRPPVSDAVLQKQHRAVQWLQRIADGTIDLPSLSELPAGGLRGLQAGWTSADRTLSREELSDH
ncbi:MAG: DUF1320 family protein [Planctomycetes bacterium]|nr:DUF1320 family protein [Planctomycetota bacterium]